MIEARAVYGDGAVGEWTRLGVSWEEGAMQVGYADIGLADGADPVPLRGALTDLGDALVRNDAGRQRRAELARL